MMHIVKETLLLYYEARQMPSRLLANAGYATFARKEFSLILTEF